MATKKATATQTTPTGMRRCIGSARFGIEAHEAPVTEFPVQPSAKDGLGRMCHTHWRAYTNALRKGAVARKAVAADTPDAIAQVEPVTDQVPAAGPEALAQRKGRRAKVGAEAEEVAAA
jgi:hypothetical protein